MKRDSEKAKKKTTDTPQSRRPNRSFCVTFRRKPVPKRHSRWKNLTGANMRRSSRYTTIISFFPREILETAFNTVPRVQINPITGHCNGNERRAGRGGRCADSAARRVSISLHFRPFGGSHRSSRNDSACQSVSPPFFFSTVELATHFRSGQFRQLLLMSRRGGRNETGSSSPLVFTAAAVLYLLFFF